MTPLLIVALVVGYLAVGVGVWMWVVRRDSSWDSAVVNFMIMWPVLGLVVTGERYVEWRRGRR